MEYSNAQRWSKFVLTPTMSTLENEGRGEDPCQALFTDEDFLGGEPATQPDSNATVRISRVASTGACFVCTRQRPVLRILNAPMIWLI